MWIKNWMIESDVYRNQNKPMAWYWTGVYRELMCSGIHHHFPVAPRCSVLGHVQNGSTQYRKKDGKGNPECQRGGAYMTVIVFHKGFAFWQNILHCLEFCLRHWRPHLLPSRGSDGLSGQVHTGRNLASLMSHLLATQWWPPAVMSLPPYQLLYTIYASTLKWTPISNALFPRMKVKLDSTIYMIIAMHQTCFQYLLLLFFNV